MTHTPTPWEVDPRKPMAGTNYKFFRSTIQGTDKIFGKINGHTMAKAEANASHIIKCVNNHDALVAALSELRWAVNPISGHAVPSRTEVKNITGALSAASSVLRKVEGTFQ